MHLYRYDFNAAIFRSGTGIIRALILSDISHNCVHLSQFVSMSLECVNKFGTFVNMYGSIEISAAIILTRNDMSVIYNITFYSIIKLNPVQNFYHSLGDVNK